MIQSMHYDWLTCTKPVCLITTAAEVVYTDDLYVQLFIFRVEETLVLFMKLKRWVYLFIFLLKSAAFLHLLSLTPDNMHFSHSGSRHLSLIKAMHGHKTQIQHTTVLSNCSEFHNTFNLTHSLQELTAQNMCLGTQKLGFSLMFSCLHKLWRQLPVPAYIKVSLNSLL